MHPYLMSQIASEHTEDMRKQATAARRARQARRGRRALNALSGGGQSQPRSDLAIRPVFS
jgi:hypothetical protein